jgi:hypothetical protein
MNEGIKPNKIRISYQNLIDLNANFKKKEKNHIKNTRNIHDLDKERKKERKKILDLSWLVVLQI